MIESCAKSPAANRDLEKAFVLKAERLSTAHFSNGSCRRRCYPWWGALALMLVLCAEPSVGRVRRITAGNSGATSTPYRNTAPGVAYVGPKVCAECHTAIYEDYRKTDMGNSMALPSDPGLLEKVPTPATIEARKFNRFFEVHREGPNLYQTEYELGPDGKEVFRNTQRIEYVIGFGVNGRSYLVRRGNYLFEAPLSFYSKAVEWNLSPGYEFEDYGFSRLITAECLACHSGRPRPVTDREGLYQNPPIQELAIGCENCHGPGQLHVEERQKGARLSGPIDRTIVNPAKLPGWLADNICMNCHQGGDTRIPQPGKDPLDFRPGTPLDSTVAIFAVPFSRESPPKSPLLQHHSLVILSRCYRSSAGKLRCLTCHDPHHQPTPGEAPRYYRSKCLACHPEKSCSVPLAVRLGKTPPNDCAGCHMPKEKLDVIAHSALTNHRIIVREGEPYPEIAFQQTTPALPDLVHVNAIPGQERLPVSRVTLLKAYGDLMVAHPVYRDRYRAVLDELAPGEPNDHFVLAALAREEAKKGTSEAISAAIRNLSRALDLGSTSPADFEGLADLLSGAGRIPEAIAVLKRGIEVQPYSSRLYKTLAVCEISLHQYPEALDAMKKELELFPEDSFMRMLVKKSESNK